MNKLTNFICIVISCFAFSQKLYKKISTENVNQERLDVVKKFAQEFLEKCQTNDYSKFQNFIIDQRALKLNDSIKESCEEINRIDGKIKILNLNSSYYHNFKKDYDPLDLFIFDIKTEKNPNIKYLSVWVYKDKNVISGLWFSDKKPLYRKSFKKKKK